MNFGTLYASKGISLDLVPCNDENDMVWAFFHRGNKKLVVKINKEDYEDAKNFDAYTFQDILYIASMGDRSFEDFYKGWKGTLGFTKKQLLKVWKRRVKLNKQMKKFLGEKDWNELKSFWNY